MQISSRFTMAIHMFACIDTFSDQKMTSDFMAASIGTNPVIIRKILQQLKAAGLIEVARGTGGVTITRPLEQITFLDVTSQPPSLRAQPPLVFLISGYSLDRSSEALKLQLENPDILQLPMTFQ